MEYRTAANYRQMGVGSLISNRLMDDSSTIGGAIRGGISDRFQASLKGFKEKVDPLNIAKTLTFGSSLGPALLGKLLGRSKEDISYFTGIDNRNKRKKGLNPLIANRVTDSPDASIRAGDPFADALGRIYSLFKATMERDKLQAEIQNDFKSEQRELIRNHKDVIKTIKNVSAHNKKVLREVKASMKEKEPPTGSTGGGIAATAGAAEATGAVGEAASTATKVTSRDLKISGSAMARAFSGKILTGTFAAAAAMTISGETGATTPEKALTKVGQVVDNDPKPGVASYGIFGINSGGSVQTFVKDNPQFELKSKPGTKEFEKEWKMAAIKDPKSMYDAQLSWYKKYNLVPLSEDLYKTLPKKIADDPGVFVFMADRRNQMYKLREKSAFEYASGARTPEEFINKVSEYDYNHVDEEFPTYLQTHPNGRKGLFKRFNDRKNYALSLNVDTQKPSAAQLTGQNITAGNILNTSSMNNRDLKEQLADINTLVLINNNTSVVKQGDKTTQVYQQRPPYQESTMLQAQRG